MQVSVVRHIVFIGSNGLKLVIRNISTCIYLCPVKIGAALNNVHKKFGYVYGYYRIFSQILKSACYNTRQSKISNRIFFQALSEKAKMLHFFFNLPVHWLLFYLNGLFHLKTQIKLKKALHLHIPQWKFTWFFSFVPGVKIGRKCWNRQLFGNSFRFNVLSVPRVKYFATTEILHCYSYCRILLKIVRN